MTLPNGPLDLLPTRTLYEKLRRPVVTRHGGHLFFFSKRSLLALLERVGLKLLTLRSFHVKSAAKARGWTPGAYDLFLKKSPPAAGEDGLDLEAARALIGPAPSWTLYQWQAHWRRLWRLPGAAGADFELLAEKN